MKWQLTTTEIFIIALFSAASLAYSAAGLPCEPTCQYGECVADHGNLSCRCEHNWFGEDCSEFLCEHDSEVCQNGGTCVHHPENETAVLCACPDNVFGDHCQYIVHSEACARNPCGKYGRCYGLRDGYECVCNKKRYGRNCEFRGRNACDDVKNCYGNGVCTYDSLGQPYCTCITDDYEPIFDCRWLRPIYNACQIFFPCQNEGNCSFIRRLEYDCICPPGYIGKNCTIPFDVCDGKCENGGSCSVIAGGHYFECSCPTGYSGQHCEIPDPQELECSHTCQNGGTQDPVDCSCTCNP